MENPIYTNRAKLILKKFAHILPNKNSEVTKNILVLFSGNSIAQLIPILAYPFLTRIYSPEEFGIYGIYLSIFSIVSVILHLRLELAIPLTENNKELSYVFKTSIISGIIISTLFLFVSLIVRRLIFSPEDEIYSLFPWLGVNLLFFSANLPIRYLAVHRKKYKSITLYDISFSLLSVTLRVLFGLSLIRLNGLVLSQFITTISCSIFFLILLRKEQAPLFQVPFKFKLIKEFLCKFRGFPKFNSFHALANSLGSNIPYLVLTAFFSKEIAGFYTLSAALLLKPVNIIANTLNTVFYQRHAENIRKKVRSAVFFQKSTLLLATTTLPIFIVLFFLKPDFFGVILGKDWTNITKTIQILLPWVFMVLITSPISFVPNSTNFQQKNLIFDLIYTGLKIMALFAGILLNDWYKAIMFYSFTGVLFLFFYLYWYNRLFLIADKRLQL